MRVIKFRVWDLTDKEWVNHTHDCHLLFDKYFDLENGNGYIFQQFTGLKDKNGKEIYEGDFIIYSYNDSDFGYDLVWSEPNEVYWNNEEYKFALKSHKFHNRCNLPFSSFEIEIIGNIFETRS